MNHSERDRMTGEMERPNRGLQPVFDILGSSSPDCPVLLSVPHAGREYSPSVVDRCRLPQGALRRLEDRYADLLIAPLVDRGFPAIVARTPRAIIDMNRDARDIDPHLVSGIPRDQPLIQSAKQRGGLGLFPRWLPRAGDLWRTPMPWEEARACIEGLHIPYHRAIGAYLENLRAHHDDVLLIDVHSMPPLPAIGGARRADVVIGDRFGSSAMSRLAEAACAAVSAHGLTPVLNHPYPGYYLVERHSMPHKGRHALQIEISRDLYLDAELKEPGRGLAQVQAMLAELVERLVRELVRESWSEAAE